MEDKKQYRNWTLTKKPCPFCGREMWSTEPPYEFSSKEDMIKTSGYANIGYVQDKPPYLGLTSLFELGRHTNPSYMYCYKEYAVMDLPIEELIDRFEEGLQKQRNEIYKQLEETGW